jgi:ubiquitin carboxyl-terminal hydrolase L3
LDKLLKSAIPLSPAERSALVEQNPALAQAHQAAAAQGDTPAPGAQDDVDLHYVAFVRSNDGALWELDGRRKGPLNRGQLDANKDVLSTKALALGPLKFLEREGADLRFSCVALAGSFD